MLRESTLRIGDNVPVDVTVTDLSTTGFSVETPLDLEVGAIVRLGLGGAGTAAARIVRRTEILYGCQFITPLSTDRVDAAFKYTEILSMMGGSGNMDIADDNAFDESDRLSRRIRLAVLLGSAGATWAAIIAGWHAI